jgi:hypothetical protein
MADGAVPRDATVTHEYLRQPGALFARGSEVSLAKMALRKRKVIISEWTEGVPIATTLLELL